MEPEQVQEVWTVLKEYFDKKQVEQAAERYVDLLADYGLDDKDFVACLGADSDLDNAISYYLDIDEDDVLEEELDWD